MLIKRKTGAIEIKIEEGAPIQSWEYHFESLLEMVRRGELTSMSVTLFGHPPFAEQPSRIERFFLQGTSIAEPVGLNSLARN